MLIGVRNSLLTVAAGFALSGCASYPKTPRLDAYDLTKGYRFEQLPKQPASIPTTTNSDELFVVLAFSGGGTRAAALSYGVLAQLAKVSFHFNAATGEPEPCTPVDSPRCQAMARTLLDEVDVISSVSGGSFTSAYYALNGRQIFDPQSTFHRNFLYYPVQRDLLSHAVYYPQNWLRLRSRVEIAANDYARSIFGNATFSSLRSRPYLILNGTDASTGARFEFTQEQFDLLCADLGTFPIARGVAASSAFPGLLNAMTIDSFNGVPRPNDGVTGCGYTGPGSRNDDWVADALDGGFIDYRRFNAARTLQAYRNPERRHLHVLDGGLADNIGLRSVLGSLESTDRPTVPLQNGGPILGGWNLLTMINLKKVRTIVVVTVNARTHREKNWDQKTAGPGTFSVIGASNGIPMGNYSTETIQLLREFANEAALNRPGRPRFFGVEVAFENVPDAEQDEREFLAGMGTNFDLSRFEVNCLIDRGARLLRRSFSVTDLITPQNLQPQSFVSFVEDTLGGRIDIADVPHPAQCTAEAGTREIGTRPHYVDVGGEFAITTGASDDIRNGKGGGVAVRVTRPDGFGMLVGFGSKSFDVAGEIGGGERTLGHLSLRTLSAGLAYTRRVGAIEASGSLSGGYGFGGFSMEDDVREAYGRTGIFALKPDATNSWVIEPGVSVWYSLNSKFAVTVSGSYTYARPTLRFGDESTLADRRVTAAAFRFSTGLAYRVF